jgi:small nuclear ribonucleoprotein
MRYPQSLGSDIMVMPLALLEKSLDKKISLLLKDNRILEGKLVGYDDYMNMVLEDTEERTSEQTRRLGIVVLRGNNVVSISPM